MKRQQLFSLIRQAIDDFGMIEEGDRIAVGVSGGKDSLALLEGLSALSNFYPKRFEIVAITVDLGYRNFNTKDITKMCEKLKVSHYVVKTQISDMIAEGGCSLCARLRKGALNDKAVELSCNKIAYAHNMDDVVETMLLSLIYEGRFSSFWPITHYEDNNLTLIRPLIYVSKANVTGFCNKHDIQVIKNPCPYDSETERTYVRKLLGEIEEHARKMKAPGVKKRMMTAIMKGDQNWKEQLLKK